jgi:hypothetical protein
MAGNAAGVGKMFLLLGTETQDCDGSFQSVRELADVDRWLVERG